MIEEKRIYDIIIPVYGGLPYLEQCIKSIVENTKHPYNLVIIDDGNGPFIKEYLRTVRLANIITNRKNLGWLKSCNIGIENSENDVILLNSDTLVTEGWLEKMDRCAYSNSRVGMVNPLSNNAFFLSIPYPFAFNGIATGFTLESFSNLVSELSERRYPSIPTVIGFCLMIKRKIFDCVGLFDEKFKLGYGEDNDFCMRAKKKGYKAVCCDDAFVYHYGNKSFGDSLDMKVYRIRANEKFLSEYGRIYERAVNEFNKKYPLKYLHNKVLMKISEITPEYTNKVSVIMPVYNREKYLHEAIKSVLTQTYSDLELIIIDDGSTDNSLNIAAEIARHDKRVVIISLKERRGVAGARNEGLKRARGEFITQFDSDDVMLPGAIEARVRFLNSNRDVDLVFGKIHRCIDKDGKPIDKKYYERIPYMQYMRYFYEMKKDYNFYEKIRNREFEIPNVNSTSMFRRNLLFQAGYYQETLTHGYEDKEFFFRIIRRANLSYLPEPIISYRMHDSNISGMMDENKREWLERPENRSEAIYLQELLGHYRKEIEKPKKVFRQIKLLSFENEEGLMKEIKTVDFSEGAIGKSDSEDNRMIRRPSQVELLLGQISHMAELIDDLREKIRNQDLAIIAKDQHIDNLNKAITPKDQHIAYLENLIRDRDAEHYQNLMNLTKEIAQIKKYSVFYNLLSRLRRELLKFFGRIRR